MVVNHETGHWLGLRPRRLPRRGPAGAGDDAAVQGAGRLPVQPVADARELASRTPRARTGHGVRALVAWLPSRTVEQQSSSEPSPGTGAQLARDRRLQRQRPPPPRPAICESLGVELSSVELTRFSNDCLQAQLQANCRQRDVYIVQPLVPPTQEHLMELLLMIDAARGASAQQITAVIPYYAYARSDKKDASRLSIGGRLVADMLVAAGVDRVITMTLHAPQVHALLLGAGRPPDRARRARRPLPRPGPQRRGRGLAGLRQRQDRHPVLPAARPAGRGRLARSGSPTTRSSSTTIVGDVEGKRAIVLDDEIATGGSIVELLERLAERGCTSAAVACTHGLFVGKAIERLREHPMITEVVTTDTVPPPADWPELEVRSVAGLFARRDRPDPRRRVGQQPLRRRRPDPRAAAAAAVRLTDRRALAARRPP